jgi:glycosyltransferase involved in cell wall biosynthesis
MNCVWVINHYASNPGDSAGGSRHFSLARRLHQLGWHPVIIAASSEHNSFRQRLESGEKRGTTEREGVVFRWLWTSGYSGNGVGRIVNMLQFTVAVLRRRSTRDLPAPQIIIGSTVHPLAAWAASRLARRYAVPFIFEIRDLWPQTLIDMGRLSQNGLPARLMRLMERHLCSAATSIVTLLPYAADYLQTIGVDPKKVVWISNGTDVGEFDSDPITLTGDFGFLYFGALGHANGLPAILRGFADTVRDNPDVRCQLVLVGNGPEQPGLERLALELDLGDLIEFRPAVPKDQIPTIATGAHCLMQNVLDLKVYRYGISPNKLFDYMAAGRPIVIASNSANNPVRDSDGGVCVPGDDSQAIGMAMTRVLRAGSQQRAVWGRNSATYVAEHFDYRVLGEELDSLLREAIAVKTGSVGDSSPGGLGRVP